MSQGKQMLEQLRLLTADGPERLTSLSKVDDYQLLALHDATQSSTLEFFDYDRYSSASQRQNVDDAQCLRT